MTSSTTTLKLPASLKKRIAALAAKQSTTSHALMVSALEEHVARAERWQEFVEQAATADRAAEAGGPVYRATDIHGYLDSVVRGEPARRPRPSRR